MLARARSADPLARMRGPSERLPDASEPGRPRLVAERDRRPVDGGREPVPGREARLGVLDRRGEDGVARQAAPPAVRVAPRSDRAGDGDAERAAERDPVEALVPERLRRRARRRSPGAVEPDLLGRRLVPHQPERVAADPAAVGHDDGEDRVGRDGGVDRVPARRQDVEPGGRREVVRRDDRPARAAGQPRRDHRRGPARVSHRPRPPPRAPRAGPVRCPPGARSAVAATAAAARSPAG